MAKAFDYSAANVTTVRAAKSVVIALVFLPSLEITATKTSYSIPERKSPVSGTFRRTSTLESFSKINTKKASISEYEFRNKRTGTADKWVEQQTLKEKATDTFYHS